MIEQTLCIIKPDAVRRNLIGSILAKLEGAGFKIAALKEVHLTHTQAERFYIVHQARPFFHDLVKYMCSYPCVAVALMRENAVQEYRNLLGDTDPAKAAPGTIRHEFGLSKEENACHGSDSPENGIIEVNFFFNAMELIAQ